MYTQVIVTRYVPVLNSFKVLRHGLDMKDETVSHLLSTCFIHYTETEITLFFSSWLTLILWQLCLNMSIQGHCSLTLCESRGAKRWLTELSCGDTVPLLHYMVSLPYRRNMNMFVMITAANNATEVKSWFAERHMLLLLHVNQIKSSGC